MEVLVGSVDKDYCKMMGQAVKARCINPHSSFWRKRIEIEIFHTVSAGDELVPAVSTKYLSYNGGKARCWFQSALKRQTDYHREFVQLQHSLPSKNSAARQPMMTSPNSTWIAVQRQWRKRKVSLTIRTKLDRPANKQIVLPERMTKAHERKKRAAEGICHRKSRGA